MRNFLINAGGAYVGQSATPEIPDELVNEVVKVVVAIVSALLVQWIPKLFKKRKQ